MTVTNGSRPIQPGLIRPMPTAPQQLARAKWLLNRAAAMDGRECAHRLVCLVKMQRDIVASRTRWHSGRRGHAVDRSLCAAVLSSDRAAMVRRVVPDQVPDVVELAGRFAAGDFALLGYPPVRLPRPIPYEADPFTGRSWPRRHGLAVDYRSSSVGDPKWIWELNRLQHVPLLLTAGLLARDEGLREMAVEDTDAWLGQSRRGVGIAWSNAYEAGLRGISLALTLDALRDVDECREMCSQVLDSLHDHVDWILRYPSLHSSANNHRVGELVGLIAISALAPELRLDAVGDRALEELRVRCEEQVAPDGGHREQAFGYMVFTTELVLLAAGILRGSGRQEPSWLGALLQSVERALAVQLGTQDPEPRYGDCDNGGPTLLGGHLARSGRSVLAAVRYALGEPDPALLLGLEPSALWLLGDIKPKLRAHARDRADSAWLSDSGLVILRSGSTTVTFDVGQLGFGRLAAHGHADALHVTLSEAGSLVVGDPGTGSYFGNSMVRDAFRGTGFHATVMVDSRDQAEPTGPFLWRSAPEVDPIRIDVQNRFGTAAHNGYARLADGVVHRRTVMLIEQGLVIVRDALEANAPHSYSQRWPLPPGSVVEALERGRFLVRIADQEFVILTTSLPACMAAVTSGATVPFEGWWSDRLESIVPAPILRFDVAAVGGARFITLLASTTYRAIDQIQLEARWNEDACIVCNGRNRLIQFLEDGSVRESDLPGAKSVGVPS